MVLPPVPLPLPLSCSVYIDENEDGGVCVHIKSFGDILKWFGPLVTDTETVLDRIPRILEKE